MKSPRHELPRLCIVVPCYNEEEVLPVSSSSLEEIITRMTEERLVSADSYICFVNDGSSDETWNIIRRLMQQSSRFSGINLSRNFGHQAALLAGLFTAAADIYISIDADLQDDEKKIVDMVTAWHKGAEIVYGCRAQRKTDTWFKRCTAQAFYKLRALMGVQTIPNHADFRLMSACAVAALKEYKEVNLYIRGIIPMLGFPTAKVYYDRKQRELGISKYPLRKMLSLAWNGVVNFSEIPLRFILILGLVGILLSFALLVWSIISWYNNTTIAGWTSIICAISLFGSLQLLCIGCLGLYLGKVFKETKHRPIFTIQDNCTPQP